MSQTTDRLMFEENKPTKIWVKKKVYTMKYIHAVKLQLIPVQDALDRIIRGYKHSLRVLPCSQLVMNHVSF